MLHSIGTGFDFCVSLSLVLEFFYKIVQYLCLLNKFRVFE